MRRASLVVVGALIACVGLPMHVAAQGERVLVGVEGALLFPVTSPQVDRFYPGATISAAAQFSVTNHLMPLVRARGGVLPLQPQTSSDVPYLVSVVGGLRFRPRGIAHPEEPSRASCIWAEVDAGIAMWSGLARPTFEAAIGFGFLVDDVTMGPVVRFVHVLSTTASDGPDPFLMTVGLELLFGDAR